MLGKRDALTAETLNTVHERGRRSSRIFSGVRGRDRARMHDYASVGRLSVVHASRRGVVRLISGDYESPRLIRIFAPKRLNLSGMRKAAFEPCIPTRGTKVPVGPDWIHEIKHDGYRLIIQREGKRCGCSPEAIPAPKGGLCYGDTSRQLVRGSNRRRKVV